MAKTKRVNNSDKVPELNKARQDKGPGWSVEKEGSCGSESERQQGVKAATFRQWAIRRGSSELSMSTSTHPPKPTHH